jgi:hypothetical protein
MKGPPPPVRFLLSVIGLWIGLRLALSAPGAGWGTAVREPASPAAGTAPEAEMPGRTAAIQAKVAQSRFSRAKSRGGPSALAQFGPGVPIFSPASMPVARASTPDSRPKPVLNAAAGGTEGLGTNDLVGPGRNAQEPFPVVAAAPAAIAVAPPGRRSPWSLSAWLFVRRGRGEAALVPAGTLGGSQAGTRLTYRLGARPDTLSLSLRGYAPLSNRRAAEAAAGLDWKPLRFAPLHLLAERRQALGPDGRSAFGLTAYGGVDEAALGPLRLSIYAQAGAVGARRRDLFADGAARLTVPLGRLRIGAGAWAAAQPGVSRVDAGPHADLTLPIANGFATLSADWRLRVAGDARPGSGPALTLSTGF